MRSLCIAALAGLAGTALVTLAGAARAQETVLRYEVTDQDRDGVFLQAQHGWIRGGLLWQLDTSHGQMTDAPDQSALRLLVGQAAERPFRLGVSAATASHDGVSDDATIFGLHGLYQDDGRRYGVTFHLPDHLPDSGAFSIMLTGVERISPAIDLTAQLYRLSTDMEMSDCYSIRVALEGEMANGLTLAGAGVFTGDDDWSFRNRGVQLALGVPLGERVTLGADLTVAQQLDKDYTAAIGVQMRVALKDSPVADALFDAGPLIDRLSLMSF